MQYFKSHCYIFFLYTSMIYVSMSQSQNGKTGAAHQQAEHHPLTGAACYYRYHSIGICWWGWTTSSCSLELLNSVSLFKLFLVPSANGQLCYFRRRRQIWETVDGMTKESWKNKSRMIYSVWKVRWCISYRTYGLKSLCHQNICWCNMIKIHFF